jgi:S-DNA-T family DNA segregation ATPase FtsK/SpoIIIE
VHLVLATQRPAGVVGDDIRANTNLRIALRLQDRADALDVVAVDTPATFPRGVPGRAVLRLGPGEAIVFQTAAVSSPGALVSTIRAAASQFAMAPPRRPWLDPLPSDVTVADLAALDALDDRAESAGGAAARLGIVDDPAHQRRLALTWSEADGNLALIGARGSGTTTALRSVLAARASHGHVYVLDARGDGGLAELAERPWCAAVVGRHDREQRGRVLRALADELARRQSTGSGGGSSTPPDEPVLLAIDGLSGLLHAVAGPADADERDALMRLLLDGVAVGIGCVATWERPAAVTPSVVAAFSARWIFHLDDPSEAGALGIRPVAAPPAVPGRIVVAGSRLAAQVARPDVVEVADAGGPTIRPVDRRPAPVGHLPTDVPSSDLPPGRRVGGSAVIAVGLDFATLAPATVELVDGEHAIVLGPARSGRSTALAALASGWCAAYPDGAVWVLDSRRASPMTSWAAARAAAEQVVVVATAAALVAAVDDAAASAACEPTSRRGRARLVVVDDAERVDDREQGLLNLALSRDPGLAILAAARPDALRTMYGHWTAVVRRSRTGLVMAAAHESDGELLGEVLPRRSPIAARPGLAWLIDQGGRRLVQVARP